MATAQEKEELVETIKGPRYYRIHISGYGGEAAYMSITKEAHDFWAPICEEHGDSDLVSYMVNDDPDECEFENIDGVPPEADFLTSYGKDDYKSSWYEAPTEYEHQWGVEFGSAYMDIDEVDSDDYSASVVREVMSREGVQQFCERIGEETDWECELWDSQECYAGEDVEYIAQMYSSEKGTFFEGVIETIGEFDSKKLEFHCSEYDNGEECITSVVYDGVEIDNEGGDTNGKGYYASVWQNA